MNYPYEQLSPEKFQEFCQALILREYQGFQCFPVGMPDGGRDGLQRYEPITNSANNNGAIAFQVKQSKGNITDVFEWLTNIVKSELPKIERLVSKGLHKYILITNHQGTSHLNVGTIDRIQQFLSETIPVQCLCLWRDDLNRRLDDAWDLKWSYPELMTGPDIIRTLIESRLSEDKERRSSAIKSFIKNQYMNEKEVKFKQVELQNNILDLFVDVPISPNFSNMNREDVKKHIHQCEKILRYSNLANNETQEAFFDGDHSFYKLQWFTVRAANFFLNELTQQAFKLVVLEGAPGQGKSTITQYISQIHRLKILNNESLDKLPESYNSLPLRLPIKVDLRDYATWLTKKNPFTISDEPINLNSWFKSFETFIAALIQNDSGGQTFSADDLNAVSRTGALLIVCDGLDEVADISLRHELINEVTKGISRLEENAVSIQAIITTRPSALTENCHIRFKSYVYFQLQPLTKRIVEEYSEKWFKAKKIEGKVRSEIKQTLNLKLDQPHLKDLARNPMQLAILLSLIHNRGSSLPDKRTALYDNYVDLFFSRESEKSETVRDNRDLLIQIHQHLAWILHTEAEKGNNQGVITKDRLREVVAGFLKSEGHDTELLDSLFNGVIERVVALVSRVEGTYEFEVQPLREYFTARYLYDTAPYSPPGAECLGTKPDRFDGIAKNKYWLNVTRFYAGCFSKGELLSLVDRLKALCNTDGYAYIPYPRELAITLLSDWVFSQHPHSVKEVTKLILDDIGLKIYLADYIVNINRRQDILLPKKCGAEEVVSHCLQRLKKFPPMDFAHSLTILIRNNASVESLKNEWIDTFSQSDQASKITLLIYGRLLGVLGILNKEEIEQLLVNITLDKSHINQFLLANNYDEIESNVERTKISLELILDGISRIPTLRKINSLTKLRFFLKYNYMETSNNRFQNETMKFAIKAVRDADNEDFDLINTKNANPILAEIDEFNNFASSLLEINCGFWQNSLDPWNQLVEQGIEKWGNKWAFYEIANCAAGIKSSIITCKESANLFDQSEPLCNRARYARLRAGQPNYWIDSLKKTEPNSLELCFVLLMIFTWTSPKVLGTLLMHIDEKIISLSDEKFILLSKSLESAGNSPHNKTSFRVISFKLPEKISFYSACLLNFRFPTQLDVIYSSYLAGYDGDNIVVLETCQNWALSELGKQKISNEILEVIQETYKKGVLSDRYIYFRYRRDNKELMIPEIAETIIQDPNKYPVSVVTIAAKVLEDALLGSQIPVLDIANEQKWFINNYFIA